MTDLHLQPVDRYADQSGRLKARLKAARRDLLIAEADLAHEQAAVNAFRMHCRLKLDSWINALLTLQIEKQSLLTKLQLLRQAQHYGIPYDHEDPFWQSEDGLGNEVEVDDSGDELILPTDTPRDKAAEKRLYRQLVRRFHPDLGATSVEIAYRTEIMSAVNIAYESQDIQTLYDLADELDPELAAELARIPDREIRELEGRIIRLRQRRRKAERRLAALRQENTARLWQKAQRLDSEDIHWWEIVRREIEQATERLQGEVGELRKLVEALEQSPETSSDRDSD